MTVDARARAGLFLAMQYPVEVPGVSVTNFLRTAKTALDGEAPKLRTWVKDVNDAMDKVSMDRDFAQRNVKSTWRPRMGLGGAPLLGAVFAVGWTPCTGPTLTAINSLSLTTGSPWQGGLLALFYALGLGIPFLLIALGLNWMTGAVAFLKRHIRLVNVVGGLFLIVIGVLMVSGVWNAWLLDLQGVIGSYVPAI